MTPYPTICLSPHHHHICHSHHHLISMVVSHRHCNYIPSLLVSLRFSQQHHNQPAPLLATSTSLLPIVLHHRYHSHSTPPMANLQSAPTITIGRPPGQPPTSLPLVTCRRHSCHFSPPLVIPWVDHQHPNCLASRFKLATSTSIGQPPGWPPPPQLVILQVGHPYLKSTSCTQPHVLLLFPTTNSWPLSQLPRQVLGFQDLPVPQSTEVRFSPHLVNLNFSNHHYFGPCPSVPHNLGNSTISFGNFCSWLSFFSFLFLLSFLCIQVVPPC